MSVGVKITDGLPQDGSKHYHYGFKSEADMVVGTIVQVRLKGGEPWYGVFSAGNFPEISTSGVHLWPSSNKLFVVSKGRGYLVDTNDPLSWSETHLSPITWYDNRSLEGTLLVCDYMKVAAYSALGLMWKTPQLSWSGIRNIEISGNTIKGEAWDDPWDCWVSFLIDAGTGKHQGGATFNLV